MQDVIIVLIIFGSISAVSITGAITLYLTKKEKIKAQAQIRTEEIQAKNRLDIELLINQRVAKNDDISETSFISDIGFSYEDRKVREKQR